MRLSPTIVCAAFAVSTRPSGCVQPESSLNGPGHSLASARGSASASNSAETGASPKTPPAPALAPLRADWLEPLALEHGGRAFVAPPVGSTGRRPILIGVHGAHDRPEWACGGWRLACKSYAFILCPQGSKLSDDKYAWTSARQIAEEVRESLTALTRRYSERLDQRSLIYAGFSQGATLADDALLKPAALYQTAIFAEGGYDPITSLQFAKNLRSKGTERVMIVCGSSNCFSRAKRAEVVLSASEVRVFLAGDAAAGHNLNETMQTALAHVWPSLVAGLPGWDEFAPPYP